MDDRPRPVLNPNRRKALAAQASMAAAAGAAKPGSAGRMVMAAVFCCLSVGLLATLALLPGDVQPSRPVSPARDAAQIAEQDNGWVGRAESVVPSEKLQQALLESPNLKAGHREVKTSFLRLNLRTVDGLGDAAVGSGKAVKAPASETGSFPASPPQRPALEDGAKPPVVVPEPQGE